MWFLLLAALLALGLVAVGVVGARPALAASGTFLSAPPSGHEYDYTSYCTLTAGVPTCSGGGFGTASHDGDFCSQPLPSGATVAVTYYDSAGGTGCGGSYFAWWSGQPWGSPSPTPTPTPTPTDTATPSPSATASGTVTLDPDTAGVLTWGMGLLVFFTASVAVAGWARRG